MKKIAIIGSTGLLSKMREHKLMLMEYENPCQVKLPTLDKDVPGSDLELLNRNRAMIEWADEVHIIYDGRSIGTVFDFGMAFALRKPVKIIFMEKKSIKDQMQQYAMLTTGGE